MPRGRPPKPWDEKKSKVIYIRATPNFHAQLSRAAQKSGLSNIQEAQRRLIESFGEPEEVQKARRQRFVADLFGSAALFYLFQFWAADLSKIQTRAGLSEPGKSTWFDSPFAHDEFVIYLNEFLGYLRPKGRRRVPPIYRKLKWRKGAVGRELAYVSALAFFRLFKRKFDAAPSEFEAYATGKRHDAYSMGLDVMSAATLFRAAQGDISGITIVPEDAELLSKSLLNPPLAFEHLIAGRKQRTRRRTKKA